MAYNLPTIRTVEDCEREWPGIITISDYDTYESYDYLWDKLFYSMCACYELPNCISYKIKFRFYPEDKVVHELSMPKMLLNLTCWRPMVELNTIDKTVSRNIRVLDDSYIVGTMFSQFNRMGLKTKVYNTIEEFGISFERSSELIRYVLESEQRIAVEFALLDQSTILTYESIFLNDYMMSEKVRELNNTEIPRDMQTSDVTDLLHKKYDVLIDEFRKTKNPIWYISKAGNHIKPKQVQELFISYGQIPDISGNVIPYTMLGNGFATGYIDPVTYFIASTGARLAAIMNSEHMGNAGYLGRNLVLISRTLTLSQTVFDCGSVHLLKLYVRDSNFLKRLENRWGTETLGSDLELIRYSTHRHLIGKTIHVRSLVTCDLGDEVCHVCYGRDSQLVSNMPGMAIFNTEVYSEPVSQNILSTKHLLVAKATKIEFNEVFNKFFNLISGDIYLKDLDQTDTSFDLNRLSIRIREENVVAINHNDIMEHSTSGSHINPPLYIYDSKEKLYLEVMISHHESLFVDASTMKMFKLVTDKRAGCNYYELPIMTLYNDLDQRLMSVNIKNHGLTDNLHTIMKLLNQEAAKFDDYSELAQVFFELLIDAGIRCRHVQAEIILNRLLRDTNNLYDRPRFSQFEKPETTILTLNKALMKTKAPTISFSFQETRRQLLNDEIYTEKKGSSYLDPLYADTVRLDRLKVLRKKYLANKASEGNK